MVLKCNKSVLSENLNRQRVQKSRAGLDELDLNACNWKSLVSPFSNAKDYKNPNPPATSTYSASETHSTKGPHRSPAGKGNNKIMNTTE